MKRQCALLVALFLACLAVPGVQGQIIQMDTPMTTVAGSDSLQAAPELILVPTPSGDVVFAEIRFDRTLVAGTEVELWPAAADSVTPDESLGRLLWVTDERTGSLVRFDVTPIIRAWQAGEIENRGLLVNVLPADEDSSVVQMPVVQPSETTVQFLYQETPWAKGKTGVKPRPGEQGRKREGQIGEQPD